MRPKIYSKKEHGISNDLIDSSALYISNILHNAGHVSYIVGGCIRDLCMNKKPKDFDISTSAKPTEIKALFKRCYIVGKRFRLSIVHIKGKQIEVSTFRKGDNSESLITNDNTWGNEVEDILRRDFTINALFYNPLTEEIVDYVQGYNDILDKKLKTIGDPFTKFKQDPVRMIRFLKFHARFSMNLDKHSVEAIKECKEQIKKSSQARILEEILCMLESGSSCNFIKELLNFEFLDILMPYVSKHIRTNDTIFNYLQQIDKIINTSTIKIPRPLLLSTITFPIVHVQCTKKTKQPELNLEEIKDKVSLLVKKILNYFSKISKKLCYSIIAINVYQFVLTPIGNKNYDKIHPTQNFKLALDFLKLRTMVSPIYGNTFDKWKKLWRKYKRNNKNY